MSVLSKPYFHDEAAAFAHLESVLWPDAPVCPHCGSVNAKHYDLSRTRIGLRKCCEKACRKQFTVKVGTVFEPAHIPLHKMLQAVYLICVLQEGHQRAPAPPHPWDHVQGGLVPVPPHPRGHAGRRTVPRWAAAARVVEIDETFIGRAGGRSEAAVGLRRTRTWC